MNVFYRTINQITAFTARTSLVALFVFIAGTAALVAFLNPAFTEKSIVKVLSLNGEGGGTGFIARTPRGKVIVTNDHVCAVSKGGYVRIDADDGTPSLKRIIKRSYVRDLCLVEGIDRPPLTIANRNPARFDRVNVLGHPGLRPVAPASGVYTGMGLVPLASSPNADETCPETAEVVRTVFGSYCVQYMDLGYTTVPIMPGNSGSPITNTDGEVIGVINSADSVGNQGMFIPLEYLREILE